jgi:hypothetical protein
VVSLDGSAPPNILDEAAAIGDSGGTPLAVADGNRVLGLIHLKDVVTRPGRAARSAKCITAAAPVLQIALPGSQHIQIFPGVGVDMLFAITLGCDEPGEEQRRR